MPTNPKISLAGAGRVGLRWRNRAAIAAMRGAPYAAKVMRPHGRGSDSNAYSAVKKTCRPITALSRGGRTGEEGEQVGAPSGRKSCRLQDGRDASHSARASTVPKLGIRTRFNAIFSHTRT